MKLNDRQLRKLQMCEFGILKDFDRICEENGLRYWLIGGTLLGAVRHQGFIPWDDDVDVVMMREDYERFLKLELPDSLYVTDHENTPESLMLYAKLMRKGTEYRETARRNTSYRAGIFVDIFPLDHYPDRMREVIKRRLYDLLFHFRMRQEYADAYAGKPGIRKTVQTVLMKGAYLLKKDAYSFLCEYEAYIRKEKAGKRLVVTGGAYGKRDIYEAEWFHKTDRILFEGVKLPVPGGYEKILRKVYGNYMKLPPEAERYGHHEAEILDFGNEKEWSECEKSY